MAAAEEKLGEEGRVLVRYSGTERLARVLVEGMDKDLVDSEARSIADAIQAAIGV